MLGKPSCSVFYSHALYLSSSFLSSSEVFSLGLLNILTADTCTRLLLSFEPLLKSFLAMKRFLSALIHSILPSSKNTSRIIAWLGISCKLHCNLSYFSYMWVFSSQLHYKLLEFRSMPCIFLSPVASTKYNLLKYWYTLTGVRVELLKQSRLFSSFIFFFFLFLRIFF